MRIIPNINIICGQISGTCVEKYGEYLIIFFLSLIMQGKIVATTPGYFISILIFVISKDMDNWRIIK
jgi:hypothetical protein